MTTEQELFTKIRHDSIMYHSKIHDRLFNNDKAGVLTLFLSGNPVSIFWRMEAERFFNGPHKLTRIRRKK